MVSVIVSSVLILWTVLGFALFASLFVWQKQGIDLMYPGTYSDKIDPFQANSKNIEKKKRKENEKRKHNFFFFFFFSGFFAKMSFHEKLMI